MSDDLALLRLHVEALYTRDARDRLLRVNEPGGGPAPRFFLGRTAEGSACWLRDDVDDALARALEATCGGSPPGDHPLGAEDPAPYEALLARAAPVERRWAGPAYAFPREIPDSPSRELAASPDAVVVTADDAELLRPRLAPWLADVAWGRLVVAVLVDGAAAAVCASVRTTPAACEAGVETAPAFRGRGLATRAVAAWARAVRAGGRVPLYSTSWENAASRGVARRLGLRQFGADLHLA